MAIDVETKRQSHPPAPSIPPRHTASPKPASSPSLESTSKSSRCPLPTTGSRAPSPSEGAHPHGADAAIAAARLTLRAGPAGLSKALPLVRPAAFPLIEVLECARSSMPPSLQHVRWYSSHAWTLPRPLNDCSRTSVRRGQPLFAQRQRLAGRDSRFASFHAPGACKSIAAARLARRSPVWLGRRRA